MALSHLLNKRSLNPFYQVLMPKSPMRLGYHLLKRFLNHRQSWEALRGAIYPLWIEAATVAQRGSGPGLGS